MAMRRKKFSTKKAGTDDVVLLEVNDASFRCHSRIPGMVLVDFISGMDEDDPKSMGIMLKSFFEEAMSPEVFAEFNAFTRDPEQDVDLEALSEMAGWLAEQYSGDDSGEAPTGPSPASFDGLDPTGLGLSEQPLGEVPI